MIRDKSYLRVDNGMLFNVTGDEHPMESVFASLKYVGQRKWTKGYSAAVAYLGSEEPTFVDGHGFVAVPRERIDTIFDPFQRWEQLMQQRTLNALHGQAVELAIRLHEFMGLTDFGITDSLLWGNGHSESDIDLVVRGRINAERFLTQSDTLYETPDFERPSPHRLKAPYGQEVQEWPFILRKKLHMGSFQGRLFSLRVVLDLTELSGHEWRSNCSQVDVEFDVHDCSDSLLFPAIYRNEQGDELVDYSVVYEGVFRRGDRVECECEHLVSIDKGKSERNRYVIRRVKRFCSGLD